MQDWDPRPSLIRAAHHFYQQGWMVGTAGNLSARLEDGSFWITVSGRDKGQLTLADFIRLIPDGTVIECHDPCDRPSAETQIHQVLYSLFPEALVCYHVHSVEANLVSQFTPRPALPLPPLEMLKGLGVREERPRVEIPIFENYWDVAHIANAIRHHFQDHRPQVPALLIRHHGVTVWASTPAQAFHAIEIMEYLFRYLVTSQLLSRP